MSEFLQLLPPLQALKLFHGALPLDKSTFETISTSNARHRVTAASTIAPISLPTFPRSTVDGFAVRAKDTHGASESLPAYLQLAGEVHMGRTTEISLQTGQCALIHTGGMMPAFADAVIMVEHTQTARKGEIEALRAVGSGENVLQIGEDVTAGEVVLNAGIRLRPAEIGGLMALGLSEFSVVKKPRIGILSSGDEVITPGQILEPGQVYDVNSYTLASLVAKAGGTPKRYGIIPDKIEAFRETAARALAENDLIIFTAGSSVSVRDLTAQTIDELGEPGVLVHGVNVRPGKPTILAVCNGKGVIGLPGNPVSALVIAGIFVTPTIEKLLNLSQAPLRPSVTARLTVNLSSQSGREDWIGVRLTPTAAGYDADPIFGKSNLIFTLARADGLLRIPPDANGLAANQLVTVKII